MSSDEVDTTFAAWFFETKEDFEAGRTSEYLTHSSLYQLAYAMNKAGGYAERCYAVRIELMTCAGTAESTTTQLTMPARKALALFDYAYEHCLDYSEEDRNYHRQMAKMGM